MKAINIMWDVDYDGDGNLLPTEIDIPEGMTEEDEITDYLSDVTGYCHEGYVLPENNQNRTELFRDVCGIQRRKITDGNYFHIINRFENGDRYGIELN